MFVAGVVSRRIPLRQGVWSGGVCSCGCEVELYSPTYPNASSIFICLCISLCLGNYCTRVLVRGRISPRRIVQLRLQVSRNLGKPHAFSRRDLRAEPLFFPPSVMQRLYICNPWRRRPLSTQTPVHTGNHPSPSSSFPTDGKLPELPKLMTRP